MCAHELAPLAGIEPTQSTFVASFPKSVGPARFWYYYGSRSRNVPLPVICPLSRSYKLHPLTSAV